MCWRVIAIECLRQSCLEHFCCVFRSCWSFVSYMPASFWDTQHLLELWSSWSSYQYRCAGLFCFDFIFTHLSNVLLIFPVSVCVRCSSQLPGWLVCLDGGRYLWQTDVFALWMKFWPASNSLRCMRGRSLLKKQSQVVHPSILFYLLVTLWNAVGIPFSLIYS